MCLHSFTQIKQQEKIGKNRVCSIWKLVIYFSSSYFQMRSGDLHFLMENAAQKTLFELKSTSSRQPSKFLALKRKRRRARSFDCMTANVVGFTVSRTRFANRLVSFESLKMCLMRNCNQKGKGHIKRFYSRKGVGPERRKVFPTKDRSSL